MLRCLKAIAGPHKMYHRMSRGTTIDQVRSSEGGEDRPGSNKYGKMEQSNCVGNGEKKPTTSSKQAADQ